MLYKYKQYNKIIDLCTLLRSNSISIDTKYHRFSSSTKRSPHRHSLLRQLSEAE